MDFFLSGSIYIEASLKPSLCSAQDLGATGIILLSKNYFQILCFQQTGTLQSCLMQDPKPPYWCKFKGRQKISGLKKRIPV